MKTPETPEKMETYDGGGSLQGLKAYVKAMNKQGQCKQDHAMKLSKNRYHQTEPVDRAGSCNL
jgi:hypothetical protein